MEVRVEDVDDALPEGCYISVRFGDVQKQAQYDAKKLYRFPDARRFGKVDIYSRIGTCDLHWNTDQPETRTCMAVGGSDNNGVRLRVSMSRPLGVGWQGDQAAAPAPPPMGLAASGAPAATAARAAKSKEVSALAKQYLQEHDVEGILTGAMRALLKSMPEDAPTFLCDYISSRYRERNVPTAQRWATKPTAPVAAPPAVLRRGPLTQASPTPFAEYYRTNVIPCNTNFLAALHGGARGAWRQVPRKVNVAAGLKWCHKPSVASWVARRRPEQVVEQPPSKSKWQLTPSVGTWLSALPPPLENEADTTGKGCSGPGRAGWKLKPSVATWRMPVPRASGQGQAVAVAAAPPMQRPWKLKPSVGTWHMRRGVPAAAAAPPDVEAVQPSGAMVTNRELMGAGFWGTGLMPGVMLV